MFDDEKWTDFLELLLGRNILTKEYGDYYITPAFKSHCRVIARSIQGRDMNPKTEMTKQEFIFFGALSELLMNEINLLNKRDKE